VSDTVIVGVDPGLAHTASVAVCVRPVKIVAAYTITTKAAGPKPDFPTVMERGAVITERLGLFLATLPNVATIAIESYEDIGGGVKRIAKNGKLIPNRWTTPAVCALIGAKLTALGYSVVWQSPSVVMTRYRDYKRAWSDGRTGLVPGDHLLTNDHLKSAACHALAYIDAHRYERGSA
jgi:hypothetical protein